MFYLFPPLPKILRETTLFTTHPPHETTLDSKTLKLDVVFRFHSLLWKHEIESRLGILPFLTVFFSSSDTYRRVNHFFNLGSIVFNTVRMSNGAKNTTSHCLQDPVRDTMKLLGRRERTHPPPLSIAGYAIKIFRINYTQLFCD